MADSRLKEMLLSTSTKTEEDGEGESIGPCASRVATKWWPGFHVKRATLISKTEVNRKTTRSFDYSHMGFREFAGGTEFTVEVNEPEKWRIRVEGRALWTVYNYLHQHRLEWIEPVTGNADKGIDDGVPVILRITIERIENEDKS